MAFEHSIFTSAEFTTFGFTPKGIHVNPVSSVGDGITEPLFMVHSENDDVPAPTPSWQSGNRAGAGELLIAGFPAEIYVKMRFRLDEVKFVGLGYRRAIWSIGRNGANNGCVMQNIYTNGASDVFWGLNMGAAAAKFNFDNLSPMSNKIWDGDFHIFEMRAKQLTTNLFPGSEAAANADVQIFMDGVQMIPDSISNGAVGAWDGSQEHYFTLGGQNDFNASDASFGEIFISSDSTATESAAPTAQVKSIIRRGGQSIVDVKVDFADEDDDPLNVSLEFSTTGAFSGEALPLTAIPGDGAHDSGWTSQPFTNTLAGFVDVNFVWDGDTDLGNGFNGPAYVRMSADDGTVITQDTLSNTVIINDAPGGSVIADSQRPGDGAIVDIDFNVFDANSNDVIILVEVSLTGAFAGEEVTATPLSTDLVHTLTPGVPLTATPGGNLYRFVWDAENEFANGSDDVVFIRFSLDDSIDPPVFSIGCIPIEVSYEDIVDGEGEKKLNAMKNEDPGLFEVDIFGEAFNLGTTLRNARTSGLVLTAHQIDKLNKWRDTDVGLWRVGPQTEPFFLGDTLAELLGTPPLSTTLTAEQIEDLNNWTNLDPSLAAASTLTKPIFLGDICNELLERRF
ncbi:MAG: hypothetical protein V3V74_07440 [Nitrosomonadaceae bacterium]